ncbi:heterokaryon incompatibility protein-domain-containing protein, partial [Parachaetomium inaequale]
MGDQVPPQDDASTDQHLTPNAIYTPLSKDEIRLAVLRGCSDHKEAISISLITSRWSPSQQYEALSYAWGDQAIREWIWVDSAPPRLCPVTQNLHAALQHLRRRDSDRVLWIDALCIDQANLEEKEQQVGRMDRIYQAARNVCVWLGPGTHESDSAMAAVPRLLGSIWNPSSHAYGGYDWELFARLLQRDWFSRRWVVQEIALAKEATVLCGNKEVSWDDFSDVISLYGSRQADAWSSTSASADARGLGASTLSFLAANALRKDGQGNILERRWSLEDLLALLPMFHAQKSHDAVYSVLSVTSDDNPFKCIDYSRPQTELFVEVFKRIADSSNSLDMMFRPWAPDTPGARLPSFIAPASRHPYIRDANGLYERRNADSLVGAPRRPIYAATRPPLASSPLLTLPVVARGWGSDIKSGAPHDSRDDSRTRSDYTLAAKGVFCCFISELSDVCENGVIPRSWLETWRQHQADGQMADLWRVLVAGRSRDGTAAPNWFRRAFASVFSPGESRDGSGLDLPAMLKTAPPSNMADFLRRVSSCVWGRRFLVSTEERAGYFGLVPREAAPGDRICLLEGCSVPVVFRGESI